MDTMLDLNDIVVFARVIEAGSFTAAARLLTVVNTGHKGGRWKNSDSAKVDSGSVKISPGGHEMIQPKLPE
jgi:hypothetical protein